MTQVVGTLCLSVVMRYHFRFTVVFLSLVHLLEETSSIKLIDPN